MPSLCKPQSTGTQQTHLISAVQCKLLGGGTPPSGARRVLRPSRGRWGTKVRNRAVCWWGQPWSDGDGAQAIRLSGDDPASTLPCVQFEVGAIRRLQMQRGSGCIHELPGGKRTARSCAGIASAQVPLQQHSDYGSMRTCMHNHMATLTHSICRVC